MWKLKSCPRCSGDMFFERGMDSWYMKCIQCSCESELKDIADFKQSSVDNDREISLGTRAREK